MAHSIIEFGAKHIRVQDLDLALACLLLIAEMSVTSDGRLEPMFEDWIESIACDGPGCIDLHLGRHLSDPQRKQAVLDGLQAVSGRLEAYPEVYPGGRLNAIAGRAGIRLKNDYPAALLRRAVAALRSLIA